MSRVFGGHEAAICRGLVAGLLSPARADRKIQTRCSPLVWYAMRAHGLKPPEKWKDWRMAESAVGLICYEEDTGVIIREMDNFDSWNFEWTAA